jgi:ABC-type dipeptide/oligopeptide/nickel transport system permease subunit
MIGGSIVIESIFAYPGIGKYALDSIMLHDYPIIQGYAVLMTFSIIMINMTVDIIVIVLVVNTSLFTNYDLLEQNAQERLQKIIKQHIFGTDRFGRDVFSRTLYGGRLTLVSSFIAPSLSLAAGLCIGIPYFASKKRQNAETDGRRQAVHYPEIPEGVSDDGQYCGRISRL